MKKFKKGDTLIVTKLDKLSLSTKNALEIIQFLVNRGVTLKVFNIGTFDIT
jgi:DNA invertase Pin-like site-specific DNA recombinase